MCLNHTVVHSRVKPSLTYEALPGIFGSSQTASAAGPAEQAWDKLPTVSDHIIRFGLLIKSNGSPTTATSSYLAIDGHLPTDRAEHLCPNSNQRLDTYNCRFFYVSPQCVCPRKYRSSIRRAASNTPRRPTFLRYGFTFHPNSYFPRTNQHASRSEQ